MNGLPNRAFRVPGNPEGSDAFTLTSAPNATLSFPAAPSGPTTRATVGHARFAGLDLFNKGARAGVRRR
jgi:hypothetical protein